MSINVPKEKNGVYKFECGDEVYTYRTVNVRKYTNIELKNIIAYSFANSNYYNEPCTLWNDPAGWLVKNPRSKVMDDKFLNNAIKILMTTKNKSIKQLINRILNECLIVDEEPVLKQKNGLKNSQIILADIKKTGKYHIDRVYLDEICEDAINWSAHYYTKKYFKKDDYDKYQKEEMEILSSDK